MDVLIVIDIGDHDLGLAQKIGQLRKQNPNLPAIYAFEYDLPSEEICEALLLSPTDKFFIKEDVDSSLSAARSLDSNALEFVKQSGYQQAFVVGVTHYGCVLGAAREVKQHGIVPYIVSGLTDYDELTPDDHEEGMEDWEAANITEVTTDMVPLYLLNSDGPSMPSFP